MAKLTRRRVLSKVRADLRLIVENVRKLTSRDRVQQYALSSLKRVAAYWPALSELIDARTVPPVREGRGITRAEQPQAAMATAVTVVTTSASPSATVVVSGPALDELLRALRNPDADTAVAAIEELGTRGELRARKGLLEVLRNVDGYFHPMTRVAAIRALSRGGDDAELTPLVEAIGDFSAEVSLAAITALSQRAPRHAIEPLTRVMQDSSGFFAPPVRLAAERALARIQ